MSTIYTLYVNGVEDVVFRTLALEKLRKVLNSLPKESRELIELYYYDEYTMEQIGRMYGISKMAVSKRTYANSKQGCEQKSFASTGIGVFRSDFCNNLIIWN